MNRPLDDREKARVAAATLAAHCADAALRAGTRGDMGRPHPILQEAGNAIL